MKNFLLDTDTCISLIRGNKIMRQKIARIGSEHCFLSEITVAELRFGAERSNQCEKEHRIVDLVCEEFAALTISKAIRSFATEKARLWNIGQKVSDFDLLIGATALHHGLILVTNNTKHFERMQSLQLENWM
ncbi:MAG: PIN domain-containing protein [Planctomycetaceae bacterium]|jgi:tRNA(fMet)-specific endonuclease VapC|nr:PIN domain-containing protein [Planctomycetaceae bacterium]